MTTLQKLQCIACSNDFDLNEVRYHCECGGLLSVVRENGFLKKIETKFFDDRLSSRNTLDKSGVWRFREAILDIPSEKYISHPEGATFLYSRPGFNQFSGSTDMHLKHEGENPTGSFKDRGMTAAISQANSLGKKVVACASTGNTSASLAAYAAQASMKALVFIPAGKISSGKLAQALAYGATCLSISGDFDDAMKMVQQVAEKLDVYMVNSLNPFRHEGQKSIIWEIFQDLNWQSPDWIVVPGGNLGNTSSFGKAINEAFEAGWITKKPKIATIQAEGANPFYQSYKKDFRESVTVTAETIASAIRIGNPVNFAKAVNSITSTEGIVEQVTEKEIMTAKRFIDGQGIGCEPASACSLAGIKKLISKGVIKNSDKVVGILTGNMLKDTDAIMNENFQTKHDGRIIETESNLSSIEKIVDDLNRQ